MTAADGPLALGQDVDEGLAIEAQRHRPAQVEIVERWHGAVDDQIAAVVVHDDIADRLRRLALDVLQQRDPDPDQIELAGDEGQRPGRGIGNDRIFDAIEIGPARLPVIRIARHRDALVGLVLDEFERSRADRTAAHVAQWHVARIDRRLAGSEQRDQIRLRPFQMKGDLVIAVGGDFIEVAVPGFAGIDPELLARLAGERVPGAFDVRGGERLAVVPFDALTQAEGQRSPGLVPRPVAGEIGDDRGKAVLRHVLVEENEIVEDAHQRSAGRDRRFLVDRHARRAGEIGHLQNAALLLREC